MREDILHVTQTGFAEVLGMEAKKGRSTINNWEQGAVQIKSDDLERICRATGASADYLLGLSPVWRRSASLQNINAEIGLSEAAIVKLLKMRRDGHADTLLVLSKLIESNNAEFFLALLSSLFAIDNSSDSATIKIEIDGKPLSMSTEAFLIEHIKTLFVQDILDLKYSIGKRRVDNGEH